MSKTNILYVDDDRCFSDLTKMFLENNGISVTTTTSTRIALKYFNESKPDIILLDVYMPQKNGLIFLDELRKKDRDIPIIMYSSVDNDEIKIKSIDKDAKYFVSKNQSQDYLLSIIKNILRNSNNNTKIRLSDITIFNTKSFELTINGVTETLRPTEGLFMKTLSESLNQWLSSDTLYECLSSNKDIRYLQRYIHILRSYIKKDKSLSIENKHGGFYILKN